MVDIALSALILIGIVAFVIGLIVFHEIILYSLVVLSATTIAIIAVGLVCYAAWTMNVALILISVVVCIMAFIYGVFTFCD